MHDAKGLELKIGDKVLIPCEVTKLSVGFKDRSYASLATTIKGEDGFSQAVTDIATDTIVKVAHAGETIGL